MKKKFSLLLFFIILFIPVLSFSKSNDVYVIKIEDEINGATTSHVESSIKKAKKQNVDTIIFEIDTYGGQVVAAEKIKNLIIDSNLKTIAYVNNKAESAGVLITIACEKVYMSKTATIGSAETIPKTEKNISFWRSILRDTAQYRNRNPEVIEAMADSDMEIPNISNKGKLVNLTSKESLDYGISDGTVRDYKDILKNESLENKNIVNIKMSFENKLVKFVSNPIISTILITLAMVSFVIEIFVPSFGFFGSLSVLSFGLFFIGNIVSGNANIYAFLIFLLGLLLVFIEFLIPGFGLAGISGIILLVIGIIRSMKSIEIAMTSVAVALIITIIVAVIFIKKGANSKFIKRITLNEKTSSENGYLSVDNAKNNIGDTGITITPLKPIGFAIIANKKVEVISESGYIESDTRIIVSNVEGSKVIVKKE